MFQDKKLIQNKNLESAVQCALEKGASECRMNAWRDFKSSCQRYLPADHFNINTRNDKKLNILLIFTILFVYLNIRLIIRWIFLDCHLFLFRDIFLSMVWEFSSNYWSWSVFAKQPVNAVLMILKDWCMIKRTKGFIGYIFLSHIGFLRRFSSQPQFTVWIF